MSQTLLKQRRLDARELAKVLGVNRKRVNSWVANKLVRNTQDDDGVYRFDLKEVLESIHKFRETIDH